MGSSSPSLVSAQNGRIRHSRHPINAGSCARDYYYAVASSSVALAFCTARAVAELECGAIYIETGRSTKKTVAATPLPPVHQVPGLIAIRRSRESPPYRRATRARQGERRGADNIKQHIRLIGEPTDSIYRDLDQYKASIKAVRQNSKLF
jgi:hypothetical protein